MTDILPATVSDYNLSIYQRLKLVLRLGLRHQILLAVCDDAGAIMRLSNCLEIDLNPNLKPDLKTNLEVDRFSNYPHLVSLNLNLNHPNPWAQIDTWLAENPPALKENLDGNLCHVNFPVFQILRVEMLTRQSPIVQWQFFKALQQIPHNITDFEYSILFWLTRPWLYAIQKSAPNFWRCCHGVFEFVDEELIEANNNQAQSNPKKNHFSISLFSSPTVTINSRFICVDRHAIDNQNLNLFTNLSFPTLIPQQLTFNLLNFVAKPKNYDFSGNIIYPSVVYDISGGKNPGFSQENSLVSADLSIVKFNQDNQETITPSVDILLNPEKIKTSKVNGSGSGDMLTLVAEDKNKTKLDNSQIILKQQEITNYPKFHGFILDYYRLNDESWRKEEWLQICQNIEELYQEYSNTENLALAYRDLGNFWRDRIENGETSAENLLNAIRAYEQTLALLDTKSSFWADLLNDLANLYWMLSRISHNSQQSISYLQQAIQSYQGALRKTNPDIFPHIWARLQNNLGSAYSDLARYENPAENLLKSIESFEQALIYRRPDINIDHEDILLQYAATQNNLGAAYWHLAQQEKPVINLKKAISAYQESIHYYSLYQDILNYAMVENNLGTAYWNLSQYEKPEVLLNLAINCYQAALKYRTPKEFPAACAATLNNLGTAYWHLAKLSKNNYEKQRSLLQKAIDAYEESLKIGHQIHQTTPLSFDIFATHNNLGLAYYQLATDVRLPLDAVYKINTLETALQHHIQACNGWQQQADFYESAVSYVIQIIRAFFNHFGLQGQNQALSKIPAYLLPDVMRQF